MYRNPQLARGKRSTDRDRRRDPFFVTAEKLRTAVGRADRRCVAMVALLVGLGGLVDSGEAGEEDEATTDFAGNGERVIFQIT